MANPGQREDAEKGQITRENQDLRGQGERKDNKTKNRVERRNGDGEDNKRKQGQKEEEEKITRKK